MSRNSPKGIPFAPLGEAVHREALASSIQRMPGKACLLGLGEECLPSAS